MTKPLLALIKSLVITSIVSVVVAGVALLSGHTFWLWFTVAFTTQCIVFYLFNSLMEFRAVRDAHILQLREAELLLSNTMEVECASCKKKSHVIVNPGRENKYTCGYCKGKNAIYVTAETAIITEPIYEMAKPVVTTSNGNN